MNIDRMSTLICLRMLNLIGCYAPPGWLSCVQYEVQFLVLVRQVRVINIDKLNGDFIYTIYYKEYDSGH